MKSIILLFSFCALTVFSEETKKYTSKYDNIDLDEILNSDRLLGNYIDCFMDRGHCTPQGAELKANLPDALKTECSKCTDIQKEKAKKTLDFILDKKPDMYKELEAKYDPDHIYSDKIKKAIKS
ncbi:hypothetical protein HHI36_003073 [Cryptolaemus montrouzieri]|uniref:Chemosensory protein n=1 Tax=Cryptolaemus montrouzieri TaxID=559131 RepID=A0ABD2PCV9_9CUCU